MAAWNQNRGAGGDNRGRQSEEDPGPIPSPYNFVPLSPHVFFPEWADRVSMDVPFSDGISGTLQIRVEAMTPIYIRNGGAHPEGKARLHDADYSDFFRAVPGGPYAIPGTSLKGMLRGVVEIASFGKIVGTRGRTGRVSDHRYAVRDLQNPALYGRHITETRNGAYKPRVQAAWLSRGPEGAWQLRLCEFARVEQEDLERWRGPRCRLGERGPAKSKYQQIAPLTPVRFDCGPEIPHPHSGGKKLIYRKATNLGTGQTEGVIVLTGQPSDRKQHGCVSREGKPCSRGKHMEFIFFDDSADVLAVPDSVKEDFEFAHSKLGENRQPNPEWAFWKPCLSRSDGRVPVFVLIKEGKLHSMGLAMMYRFPYELSIHQAIDNTGGGVHRDGSRLDFAETLFGRVEDQDGLRGRVAVETLLADGKPTALPVVTTVLNGPKPTYYPNYILQAEAKRDENGQVPRDGYRTFMDKGAQIRGWKRYITQPDGKPLTPPRPPAKQGGEENEDVATSFRPLPAGTTFTGMVHIHNLRRQELGALLWAISWGGGKHLRHSLGMAKPYGYGSVSLKIVEAQIHPCDPGAGGSPDLADCQKAFEETMEAWIRGVDGRGQGWSESPQIQALRTMANPTMDWPQAVGYPSLGDGPRTNEFVKQKKAWHSLVDPRIVKPGARASAAPPQKPSGKPAAAPPAKLTPVQEFLKALPELSANRAAARLKALDPGKASPAERKAVCDALRTKPGFESNWAIKSLLEPWKAT
ncbi:MAG: TIGR03986 family CRISPR-associated RAMP protein [Lentisphaerae bacterium]|nr:TIGR03986 family CRISPR-associated RAMP protein [Lentisphaerota bacterium]